MIQIKTPQEIEIIKEAGKMLANVKESVRKRIEPGIALRALDRVADKEIGKLGAESAFKRVRGYKWATCINVNQGVVHGIPDNYKVKPGDKISVDVGIYYKGFNVDSAWSCGVGPVHKNLTRFLEVGKEALVAAIAQARPGNSIGHISWVLGRTIKGAGYCPVRMFTGHGVGKMLHEEPVIPCFLAVDIDDTPKIEPGMVLAIEAIYTAGSGEVIIDEDGWTAEAEDGTIGGLFEETVVVGQNGPVVVT